MCNIIKSYDYVRARIAKIALAYKLYKQTIIKINQAFTKKERLVIEMITIARTSASSSMQASHTGTRLLGSTIEPIDL